MSLTDGSDNERSRNHFVTHTPTHFSYDDDDDDDDYDDDDDDDDR